MRCLLTVFLCAVIVSVVGCGKPAGPKKFRVKGTVTFDGEPVEKGYIIFQPKSPDDQPEGADIADGEFSLTAQPGEKKVEITGSRSAYEDTPKGDRIEIEQNYVPDQYNKKTKLTAEVTDDPKSNEFEFELKSKP